MKDITVAIVDDHRLVSEGFAAFLKEQPSIQITLITDDGNELFAQLRKDVQVDVVLLDYDMPKMNGLEILRQLKNFPNRPKVLIVSMHKEAQLVRELHREGVAGYVLKDENGDELLRGIRAVAEGQDFWGKGVAEILLQAPGLAQDSDGNEIFITARELEVLKLLGEGLKSKEIAEKLFVSVNTVDTHRRNLIAKFGVNSTIQMVLAAQKAKLI